MAKGISIIGLESTELRWLRLLVSLLRHPDPIVPELARQALLHLEQAALSRTACPPATMDRVGS